jgi:L-alanine-DL-glutamate epimerase-like enolase superfamily enzyme
LRDPFRIARAEHGGGHAVTTVIVELRDDRFPGIVGVGEGYPDRYYGETPETMAAVFPPPSISQFFIWRWTPIRDQSGALQCASCL